ncbi:MAG: hypothetical protein JOZ36_14100 [Acidobacteria bacterium]|nr:hypothetical protein [Acidobacteriota bacterium]
MSAEAADRSVPREVLALLSNERLIVRETQRAVTPFGGMAVCVEFLQRIALLGQIRHYMPIRWRSHNRIDPAATLMAFLMAVLVGARRFVHANWLRGDRALQALLGITRFPSDDTIRNLFRRFDNGRGSSALRAVIGMADAALAPARRWFQSGSGLDCV